ARKDQGVGVPVPANHLAGGGEHDGGTGMAGFDETVSLHHGEFDGILNGESLRHTPSVSPLPGVTRMARGDARHPGRWQTDGMTDHVLGTHRYALTATWTGNTGTGTSGYRDYRRDVTLEVEGKPPILASSDKSFRGDASRWNPEDLLLAALSE